MIDGAADADAIVVMMKIQVAHDVERGTLYIDKDNVMRPITFENEMKRKLRNTIAWSQRHRREDEKKIEYFVSQPQDDSVERIVIQLQEEIVWLDAMEKVYKKALAEV